MVKIAINGFGRVGRAVLRAALTHNKRETFQIVAINDPFVDTEYMVYLMKYDTAHGRMPASAIEVRDNDNISIDGSLLRIFHLSEPTAIPWGSSNVDVVIDCSGVYTTAERAGCHLAGGASKVIISASSADAPVFVVGVNEDTVKSSQQVISGASCTAVAVGPLLRALSDEFGIDDVALTTVHSATPTGKVVDGAMTRNKRAARSADGNIIFNSTSAGDVLPRVLPQLRGKIATSAFYVPTQLVCAADLTVRVQNMTTKVELDKFLHRIATEDTYKGLLGVTDDDVVSSDFRGATASGICDTRASQVLNGNVLKIVVWYDNETGYAHRLLDLVIAASKAH
eukprot:PhM_4_TR14109/c0_g1_i1/m.95257/K00134/GAPDH, gapA; glyceraldehyde 3-phosphate dehydrogenase